MTQPTRPLDGIRVVDLTRALAGPCATMMLADAGADVLKVEPPTGDDSRGWLPYVDRDGARESAYFLAANRGKRSIRLDLKTEQGARRLWELVAGAAVLVENYRPGLLDRAQARARGPAGGKLATDHPVDHRVRRGRAGRAPGRVRPDHSGRGRVDGLTGAPDGEPTRVGLPMAGLFGAFGVTAALRERETTGASRAVETSLLSAVVAIHAFHGSGRLNAGVEPVRTGNRHPSIAPYGVFPCADTSIVVAVGSEGLWRKFAAVVGLDAARPDIATNDDRVRNVRDLEEEVSAALRTRTADEMLAELEAAGIPAGRIRRLPEVYAWEQVRHLGLVQEMDHPTLGPISLPGTPLRYDGEPAGTPVPPPVLGQHESTDSASGNEEERA